MKGVLQFFLTFLLVAMAFTNAARGEEEPHDGPVFSDFSENIALESWLDTDPEPTESSITEPLPTLEQIRAERRPATPTVFAGASLIFQAWKNPARSEPTPTKRALASLPVSEPSATEVLTNEALEKERAFRESLLEANVAGTPSKTYQRILSVLTGGKIIPRPIDTH